MTDKKFEELQSKLDNKVRRNEPLAEHTTFKIGGPARYFYEAGNTQMLERAVRLAHKLKLRFFVLGGGSNLLVSDEGFKGLVIKAKNSHLDIKGGVVTVDVGMWLNTLVLETLKQGLSGLEPLAGIPGTVGGAVFGNAGAWGKAIGDVIKQVEVLTVGKSSVRHQIVDGKNIDFAYRDSDFKKGSHIILKVQLKLQPEKGNLLPKFAEVIEKRTGKHPLDYPNAGSVYKNLVYCSELEHLSDLERYGKISVGKLIESLGFKGKRVGDAQVAVEHANFIVNRGEAKAAEVVELMEMIEEAVQKKYKVKLDREIRFLK